MDRFIEGNEVLNSPTHSQADFLGKICTPKARLTGSQQHSCSRVLALISQLMNKYTGILEPHLRLSIEASFLQVKLRKNNTHKHYIHSKFKFNNIYLQSILYTHIFIFILCRTPNSSIHCSIDLCIGEIKISNRKTVNPGTQYT